CYYFPVLYTLLYLLISVFRRIVFSFHLLSNAFYFYFFFTESHATEIYTLSLHDALPILFYEAIGRFQNPPEVSSFGMLGIAAIGDRKSTRLNSSHVSISYAVFCLKKKKT